MEEFELRDLRKFSDLWKQFKEKFYREPIFKSIISPSEDWMTELDWERLLYNRILPHSDCLVIAVAGGTNTGKSTITNVLCGREVSPVRHTAGATKRPVLIASPKKFEMCLKGDMFPQFKPMALRHMEDALDSSHPPDRLFVEENSEMSDNYLFLDTPDVDSIRKEHWDIADRIISASDVVIGVLTEEKYNDFAVVEFFKRVKQEGKVIIPLMNKVNTDLPKALEYAREQVLHFLKEVGLEDKVECFLFPRCANVYASKPVSFEDSAVSLDRFIYQIPVEETKQRVLSESVKSMQKTFSSWIKDSFIKKTQYLEKVFEGIENGIRGVLEKFSPIPPKDMEDYLKSAIKSRLGGLKYLVFLPGSLGEIIFRKDIGKMYELGEEVRKKNEGSISELLEATFKLLSESVNQIPEELKNEFKKRLGKLFEDKKEIIGDFKGRIVNELNLIPESILKELDLIADDFITNNPLTGLKLIRLVSVLLLVLGTGVFAFSLIPGASMVPEVLVFGGSGLLSYMLENEGFKLLRGKIKDQADRWIESKRKKVFEMIKEDMLVKLFGDWQSFVLESEEFANNECVKKFYVSVS
ncbi:MAG: 50S ribosome-binding GTPase [Candidatus Hydrogenedentes bacterium]|nr:50S ribosome-binding GTPase [Candidatus Hydrogenedentota bacterium]